MRDGAWQWRRSVESAWFYPAWFCLFASVVLVIIGQKYSERQAGIERRFQARSRSAPQAEDGPEVSESEDAEAYYSTPEDTVIPLWPLAVVFGGLAVLFGWLAVRGGYSRAS